MSKFPFAAVNVNCFFSSIARTTGHRIWELKLTMVCPSATTSASISCPARAYTSDGVYHFPPTNILCKFGRIVTLPQVATKNPSQK